MAEIFTSTSEKQSAVPQVNSWQRFLVLLEVVTLTLLFTVAIVGFTHLVLVFVAPGMLRWTLLQLGAGIVFAPAIYLVFVLSRKASKSYGVSVSDWSEGLKIGVLLSILGAVETTLMTLVLRKVNFTGWDARGNMIALCFILPNLALFGWILNFFQSIAKHMPTPLAFLALIGVWAISGIRISAH